MFQVLEWLSENEEIEDRMMGDNLASDLQIGLKNSQVDGEEIVACQASDIHTGLRLSHEETLREGPQPARVPRCGGIETWEGKQGIWRGNKLKMGSIQTP